MLMLFSVSTFPSLLGCLWKSKLMVMRITKHSRIHYMFQLGLLLKQDPRRSKKHLMGWFKRFGLILIQDIPSLARSALIGRDLWHGLMVDWLSSPILVNSHFSYSETYNFWYFYAKNVILGLSDLFPCF